MRSLKWALLPLLLASPAWAQSTVVQGVLAQTYGSGGSNTGFIAPSVLMGTLQSVPSTWSNQTFDCSVNTCSNVPGSSITGTVSSATTAGSATTATSASTATNASTANALSTTPSQCSAGNVSNGIQPNGNANCIAAYAGVTVGLPTTRTLSLATAYQATTSTKAALVTVNLSSTASLSLTTGTTNSANVYIGSTNAVATGSGTAVGTYTNSLTGTLVVGLNINTNSVQTISFALPANWFFAIVQNSGSVSINSAFDQSIS